MALTWRRWVTIVVLACAALAVWKLPARGFSRERRHSAFTGVFVPGYGFVRRFGWPDATERLSRAALHLRLLKIRDSVFTPGVLAGARSGLTVLVDHQLADSTRARVIAAYEHAWRDYDPGTQYPAAAAIVFDTTKSMNGLPVASGGWDYATVFPPDSSANVCRVVVRLRFNPANARDAAQYVRNLVFTDGARIGSDRTVLGACALFATFGKPGPGIARWLSRTGWRSAGSIDWNRESPPYLDELRWRFRPLEAGFDAARLDTWTWFVRQQLSPRAVACTAGADSACVAAFNEPTITPRDDSTWRSQVLDLNIALAGWMLAEPALGPNDRWMLSDMVHELGRAKFGAFWTSSDDPAAAFERVAREPLGAWLERWARRTYGRDVLGPHLPALAPLAGVAVLGAALLVAIVFARERRVS